MNKRILKKNVKQWNLQKQKEIVKTVKKSNPTNINNALSLIIYCSYSVVRDAFSWTGRERDREKFDLLDCFDFVLILLLLQLENPRF